jgi:hypothetical protein
MTMDTGRTDELRKAVATGEWPAVLRLWEVYAAGILAEIGRGTCTPGRMSEARQFLEWARRIALCARAQAQQRLDAIHAARQYDPQPAGPHSSLRTRM